jgi:uncharacterized protein (DUF58 family)
MLAHEAGMGYALRIPGASVPLGQGEAQLTRCLQALALYDGRSA